MCTVLLGSLKGSENYIFGSWVDGELLTKMENKRKTIVGKKKDTQVQVGIGIWKYDPRAWERGVS